MSVIRRLRTKFMPPSSFRRPRAVRDSSRFLLPPPVAVAVAAAAAVAAAGRRVRWSSLFDAGGSLGRECEVVEVVVPVRPAALRVP